MADFAFPDDDRERWAEAAAEVMVALGITIRKKMAAKIGASLPVNAGDVFSAEWWKAGLNGPVHDRFEEIAGEAAATFHEGAGWGPIPDVMKGVVAASVATTMVSVMGNRADVVTNRVDQLITEGTVTNTEGTVERNGEWLNSQLALDTGDGGPLSDSLMNDFGSSASTTLESGAAQGVLDEYNIAADRVWRCAFMNSREAHMDANGQEAKAGEPFTVGGEEGYFPGDTDNFSDGNTINCQCWLDYALPDEVPQTEGGDGVPSASMATEPVKVLPTIYAQRTWDIDQVAALAAFVDTNIPVPVAAADGIAITVEPTPAEKAMLAVDGGLAASELHVTLAYLGTIADLDDTAKLTVAGVLATVAESCPPFEGNVAGIGWFGDPGSITVALVDGDGLAALRTTIVDLLLTAGVPIVDDHDLIPHCTLAYSQVNADDKAHMPLHFNEIRLRWGTEVLAFDLMGPIETAPDTPAVPPETAPTPQPAPTEAPPMTVVSETFAPADAPIPDPSTETAPVDLSGVPDDILSAELARRAAETVLAEVAAQTGAEATPDQVAAATIATEEEAGEIMDDLTDAAEEALGIVDPDPQPDDAQPDPEDAPMPPMSVQHAALRAKVLRFATDLTAATDQELAQELARRAADAAVSELTDSGYVPTPDEVAAAQSAAAADAAEVMIDLKDTAADAIVGDEGDDEEGDGGEPVDIPFAARGPVVTWRGAPTVWSVGTATIPGEIIPDDTEPVRDPGVPFAVDGVPAGPENVAFDLTGILCVEGIMSGDGRMIAEGATVWRSLPVPLAFVDKITSAHQEGQFVGWIHEIWREGAAIWGNITLVDNEYADNLRKYLADPKGAGRFGVSVDMDDVTAVYADAAGAVLDPMEAQDAYYAGDAVVEMYTSSRITGATCVMHPAFQEANVWLITTVEPDPAIVASGGPVPLRLSTYRSDSLRPYGEDMTAIVASAGVVEVPAPPKDLFMLRPMERPEPFSVGAPLPDGTIPCYGLLAQDGSCHIGSGRRCVSVPPSADFRSFYTGKKTLTREGDLLPTGPIVMDTVHPDLFMQASDAQAFYAHTGSAVADVRLYRNEWGIVAAGVVSPDATPSQIRRLRASDVSPDWRPIVDETGRKEHKVVAVLAVNASGFLVEGIAASAGRMRAWAAFDANDEMIGLVAAGAMIRERPEGEQLAAMRDELTETRAHLVALTDYVMSIDTTVNRERAIEALAKLGIDGPLRVSRIHAAKKALRTMNIPTGQTVASCTCEN